MKMKDLVVEVRYKNGRNWHRNMIKISAVPTEKDGKFVPKHLKRCVGIALAGVREQL